MRTPRYRQGIAATLCALALGGCSKDVTTSPAGHSVKEMAYRWNVPTQLGTAVIEADSAAQEWGSVLQEAARRTHALWPKRQARITLRVFSLDADFEASVTDLDGQDVAATDAQGIMVAPSASRALNHEGEVEVLVHELTHWELHHYGTRTVPLWVSEGLAQWSAMHQSPLKGAALWPQLSREAAAGHYPTKPPANADFEKFAARSYESAAAFVRYLEQYGEIQAVRALANADLTNKDDALTWAHHVLPAGTPSFNTWVKSTLR